MRTICTKILEAMEQGDNLVLVTLIAREGSAPRGTGSQMLVGQNGRVTGTIGGGAIEGRAIQLGKELVLQGKNMVKDFSLNLTSGTDLGMVCGGSVTALFTYIGQTDVQWRKAAEEVLRHFENREQGCLVLQLADGTARVTSEDTRDYGCGRLTTQEFFLPIPLEERVVVFGGGHVAQALVPVLSTVGFRCIVFENREEFARKELFPRAEEVLFGEYERVEDTLALRETDYIIIMTNGHLYDFQLEEQLLRRRFCYLGVMGSRRKIAAVNEKLREAGISEEALRSVHTPIGLDIQAVTPAEIAISVAAECIQVRAMYRGGKGHTGCPA